MEVEHRSSIGDLSPNACQDQLVLFLSREELCNAARKISELVSENGLKQSVYLYYIARYLVAIFEADYVALPVQVWNEYRNALDHYMRHITSISDSNANINGHHIGRMEGHLQRAVLDVCKLLCTRRHDDLETKIQYWGPDVLQVIDGGDFYEKLMLARQKATDLIANAKIIDIAFNDNSSNNNDIINKYLDSVFYFDKISRALKGKTLVLSKAKQSFDIINARESAKTEALEEEIRAQIAPKAMRRAVYIGIFTGIFAGVVTGVPITYYGWRLSISDESKNAEQAQGCVNEKNEAAQSTTTPNQVKPEGDSPKSIKPEKI